MTTPLSGLESIAPIIGAVVLIGSFGFFGGLILARKSNQETIRSHADEQNSERRNRPVPPPDVNLSAEDRPADIFIRYADFCSSFSSLLRWIVPDPEQGFAAIVATTPNQDFVTIAEGLSKLSIGQLVVPGNLLLRLHSENPLIIDSDVDSAGISRWFDENDRNKIRKLCLTALKDGDNFVAVLITSAPWPSGFPKAEQQALMKSVAREVGSRWHQMLGLELQTRELRVIKDMLELRAIIDSEVEESIETLDHFTSRLCEMVDADRVAIYFVARRAGEELRPIVQCGRPIPSGTELLWQRHEQAIARVAIDSETGRLRDGAWLRQLQDPSPIGSSISRPIRINGRILGVLCLTCKDLQSPLESNRILIDFAAEILSQTLRRVLDEATIRRQAQHDHLTDLVNRRALDAYLTAEVERIRNGDSPTCSLILADLDHFKSFNDQYGHQGGDLVLRQTARILTEQVSRLRSGEHSIVARYGGEEFAVLLPDVGIAGAARIAEGIRNSVAAELIQIQNGTVRITLSLGVADCPNQADSVGTLIAAADKALYQAKSNGRNCVCRSDQANETAEGHAAVLDAFAGQRRLTSSYDV